jgi:hypothetical protein
MAKTTIQCIKLKEPIVTDLETASETYSNKPLRRIASVSRRSRGFVIEVVPMNGKSTPVPKTDCR